MATKTKSRVNKNKSNNLTQFTFRWWMAIVLIGVVAVIGIVILRYSNASGPFTATDTYGGSHICAWSNGGLYCTNLGVSTVYVPITTGKSNSINYVCRINSSVIDTYAGKAYLCPVSGG